MTFVFPALLGGLLLVGIPVLIHLIMQQKPRHLMFPAFRFLMERYRTNQRKLRLRHLLLLALRVVLIAAACLALARPRIFNERLNLSADQPVNAVLVFDTSYSMEYASGGRSRLDEAKRRALELLDDLPEGSRVAVLDSAEVSGDWLPSAALARQRIGELSLRPANAPVTARLPEAYRLLGELEQDQEGGGAARFLYIFSDRAQESWDQSRLKDLQQVRDRLPAGVRSVFVDVGAEQPSDVAIVSVELPRQAVAADDRVILRATVRATGQDCDTEIVCRIDGDTTAERKPVKLKAGQSQVIAFERRGLAPGLHQAEVTLRTSDALPFDNARFATFEVRGGRRVLVLADEPDEAKIWALALESSGDFRCEVRRTAELRTALVPADLAKYQAVCLFNVAAPESHLWETLERYVQQGGGLAVLPGGEELRPEAYNGDRVAQGLLPGQLVKVVQAEREPGATWKETTYQHPVMAPFREWGMSANVDFLRFPPAAFRYWEVKPYGDAAYVIVSYADDAGRPALLERQFDRKQVRGRVLLYTTPLDARRFDGGRRQWNDYLQTSFYLVLANKTVGYLTGDADAATFNYVSGQAITVGLPPAPRFPTYTLRGPGVSGTDAVIPRANDQSELVLAQAVTPGNFTLVGGDDRRAANFSVNVAAEECQLERVPVEPIEALLGAGAVLPVGYSTDLREALHGQWGQPVELLSWLLILVLVALAVENLLANRFYRSEPPVGEAASPGDST
jgi:hypothetical protein